MRDSVFEELNFTANEASQPNWDGYGGLPVSDLSVKRAIDFINAMPAYWPDPEVGADPDGGIAFDWLNKPVYLSISIGEDPTIAYAWADGKAHGCGNVEFIDSIPTNLCDIVRRVLNIY